MASNEKAVNAWLQAASEGSLVELSALTERSGDVKASDGYGRTALMTAAYQGNVEMVRYLIDHGADVNAADNDQGGSDSEGTALRRAVSQGHLAVVRVLLEHGAEIDARIPGGASPLMWAAYSNHLSVARLLLERGADPNIQDEHTSDQETPLTVASFQGHPKMVDLLLSSGANICQTALIFAGQGRKTPPEEYIAILRLLLSAGLSVNAVDVYDGRTALQVRVRLFVISVTRHRVYGNLILVQ